MFAFYASPNLFSHIGIILIGLFSHAYALRRLSIYFFLFKATENPGGFYLNKATEYPGGYSYLNSKCSKLGPVEEIPVENVAVNTRKLAAQASQWHLKEEGDRRWTANTLLWIMVNYKLVCMSFLEGILICKSQEDAT